MIFISYVREDKEIAIRIYHDLKSKGVDAWIDLECLLPGQNWSYEIKRAIGNSRYFIAVLSENSINKRGFYQKELKLAIDILDEFPPTEIFLIPVRIDNCDLKYEQLKKLHWVDISDSYENGFKKILATIGSEFYSFKNLQIPQLVCSYPFGEMVLYDGRLYSHLYTNLDVTFENMRNELDSELVETIKNYNLCKYCDKELTGSTIANRNDRSVWEDINKTIELISCSYCGWWMLERIDNYKGFFGGGKEITRFEGEVKHYNLNDINLPIQDLRRFLAKNPYSIGDISTTKFEKIIKDCFKDYFGPCEIVHTGGISDEIDLKMIISDKETYLVKILKRFDISSDESFEPVRELNGILYKEGIPKGIVITTRKSFTAEAHNETIIKTKTGTKYVMKLMTFNDIVSMLNIPISTQYNPWEPYLNEIIFEEKPKILKGLLNRVTRKIK